MAAADKTYILVHGGIRDFEESKPLEQYKLQDFIYERTDYERRYYSDPSIYLVTGHTPTQLIRKDMEPLIYEGAGHIAVDCGASSEEIWPPIAWRQENARMWRDMGNNERKAR